MKRAFGAVAAVGLSAATLMGCAHEGEPLQTPMTTSTELPGTTTTVTESFDAQPEETMLRVVEVRDTSASSAENAAPRHQEIAEAYPVAAAMIERSTLSQKILSYSKTIVVNLPYDVHAQLCTAKLAGDKKAWNDAQHFAEAVADEKAREQDQVSAYNATAYNFDFEVCPPDSQTYPDGSKLEVGGSSSSDGNLHIYVPKPQLIAHELAHHQKPSIGHSGGLECDPLQTIAVPGFSLRNCVLKEYDNAQSIMGRSTSDDRDSFDGFEMVRMGAISPEQIIDVPQKPGTYIYEIGALLDKNFEESKLIRIAAPDQWLPALVKKSKRYNVIQAYYPEPEFIQFELSGSSIPKPIPSTCHDLDPLALQNSPACNAQDVTVTAYRVGDPQKSVNHYPLSLQLTSRDNPGTIYNYGNVHVDVVGIGQSPGPEATGRAELRVTVG